LVTIQSTWDSSNIFFEISQLEYNPKTIQVYLKKQLDDGYKWIVKDKYHSMIVSDICNLENLQGGGSKIKNRYDEVVFELHFIYTHHISV